MSHQPKVTLFIQCLLDSLYPDVAEAMVNVLRHFQVEVSYPLDQTCCGQPAFNSGYRREATVAAQRFLNIFGEAEAIVCPSGSCVHTVRNHYPELFDDDPSLRDKALAIAGKTYEFTEYLVDVLGVTPADCSFPHSVTYHDSCHLLRGLSIARQPRQLLGSIADLNFIEMVESDQCCGFGGTFSVKYPEISTALVDEKVDAILATGADIVTGCDMSCLMNIEGRLQRRDKQVKVMHIAEILAAALGGDRP